MKIQEPTVMILAAGIGTRLMPLTKKKPKALIEYRDKPMIQHVIEKIQGFGFYRIVVNVHHHADQVIDFLNEFRSRDLEILISDERDRLMDTGGGIIRARKFLENQGPFIVHNTDIYSDIDLRELYNFHIKSKSFATLASRERETSRNLIFDIQGNLSGWRNNATGESILVKGREQDRYLAFSGIHVIDPSIFKLVDVKEPFSIINKYLELAYSEKIVLYDHSDDEWIDMADKQHYSQ